MDTNCQPPRLDRPVCILGLGLIGGSLLRLMHAAEQPVYGWNRSAETVTAAQESGVDASGDLTATLRRAAQDDALIVLAVPLFALPDLLAQVAQHAPTHATQCALTDVVSVKAEVQELVEQAGLGARFVGSHPMAGTEFSGWEATDPTLFQGATWVVMNNGDADTTERVCQLAQLAGSHIVSTDPVRHDGAVACISHVPHLVAEAVAVTATTDSVGGGDLALELAAGSFRDGTRVASTAPALVRAMCEGNRAAVLPVLRHTIELLEAAEAELQSAGTCEELVEAGYAAHQRYQHVKAEQ